MELPSSGDSGPNLVSCGQTQTRSVWLCEIIDPTPKKGLIHFLTYYIFILAGEDDLRDVISAVTDLTGRWKDLGISLGVRPCDLDTILSNNPHSSSDCLREMLLRWLRQSYIVCTTDTSPPLPHKLHQVH